MGKAVGITCCTGTGVDLVNTTGCVGVGVLADGTDVNVGALGAPDDAAGTVRVGIGSVGAPDHAAGTVRVGIAALGVADHADGIGNVGVGVSCVGRTCSNSADSGRTSPNAGICRVAHSLAGGWNITKPTIPKKAIVSNANSPHPQPRFVGPEFLWPREREVRCERAGPPLEVGPTVGLYSTWSAIMARRSRRSFTHLTQPQLGGCGYGVGLGDWPLPGSGPIRA